MIYTSYYANLKNIDPNITTISISLYPPQYIKTDFHIKELCPNPSLLHSYKKEPSEKDYISRFNKQLDNVDLKSILDPILDKEKDIVLLCYEKPSDFCHRQLVAERIESLYNMNVQEYGYEYSLRRNGKIFSRELERIAIIGSRTTTNYGLIQRELLKYIGKKNVIIVSGGAKGADSLGEKFAEEFGYQTDIFYPDWDKHGKGAGFIRNSDIIENSDIIFAFTTGSKGTEDSIKKAIKKGKIVFKYTISHKHKNVLFVKKYNKKMCLDNQNNIFVFGDNLLQKGNAGQAQIRECINSFGIPTKRLPSMNKVSFFSDQDDERDAVLRALRELFKYSNIILPIDGLGTGLASMKEKSPLLFNEMNLIIDKYFLGLISFEKFST